MAYQEFLLTQLQFLFCVCVCMILKQIFFSIFVCLPACLLPLFTAYEKKKKKARAIENQCYVIAAAQFGQHNTKRKSYGHSLVVDPWGKIVIDAGGYGRDGGDLLDENQIQNLAPKIVTCEIDQELIQSVRERMPIQTHRENASFSF